MVGLMLDAGATSDEEDRNGLTPVAIAAKQGYFDILEEFAANTSNPVNLRYLRDSTFQIFQKCISKFSLL